ncbi:MAG: hypothetical protein ACRCYQ_05750 [Nocardioides sp.]
MSQQQRQEALRRLAAGESRKMVAAAMKISLSSVARIAREVSREVD